MRNSRGAFRLGAYFCAWTGSRGTSSRARKGARRSRGANRSAARNSKRARERVGVSRARHCDSKRNHRKGQTLDSGTKSRDRTALQRVGGKTGGHREAYSKDRSRESVSRRTYPENRKSRFVLTARDHTWPQELFRFLSGRRRISADQYRA